MKKRDIQTVTHSTDIIVAEVRGNEMRNHRYTLIVWKSNSESFYIELRETRVVDGNAPLGHGGVVATHHFHNQELASEAMIKLQESQHPVDVTEF